MTYENVFTFFSVDAGKELVLKKRSRLGPDLCNSEEKKKDLKIREIFHKLRRPICGPDDFPGFHSTPRENFGYFIA